MASKLRSMDLKIIRFLLVLDKSDDKINRACIANEMQCSVSNNFSANVTLISKSHTGPTLDNLGQNNSCTN